MENTPQESLSDPTTRASAPIHVTQGELAAIRELYQEGQYRKAYDRAIQHGPLNDWRGSEARILAGRILMNLGAMKRGRVLHIAAWRENRSDLEARAYFVAATIERLGFYSAWRRAKQFVSEPAPPQDSPTARAARHYLLTLLAHIAATWRDFEGAEAWLRQAEEVFPGHPWVHTERAYLLERQDRYEEALASARRALGGHPWYRPGVQSVAHALQLLDRDEETLELLQAAVQHVESVPLLIQLFSLQMDLRRYDDAAKTLEMIPALSPVLDEESLVWLGHQRTLVAYHRGDLPRAAELARPSKDRWEQKFAERLDSSIASGAARKNVRLAVEFVRQHEHTCAPATLSALSRFWKLPAEHLEVAEAICYDGTPAHSERRWASQNGYVAREFTVTWPAAMSLLDRGVPFTLTTVDTASAHLQAVIGYDELRGTLRVRDPFIYFEREADAKALLEHYVAHGPRCMALVPQDRAALLDGINLPDAAEYDLLHELNCHLDAHRRAEAQRVLETMQQAAPSHRLTLAARRTLAGYDANTPALAACLEELLAQFPNDGNLLLARHGCLRELGRRDERVALLEKACADAKMDPVFWQLYGLELNIDARRSEAASWWLRRALRARPSDRLALSALAQSLWTQREFEEAVELYRFAACLDEKQEQPARDFFAASRWLKRTEEALRFLRGRFERFGARSALPGITLFQALAQLDQLPPAFTLLDEALALRPEDGDLLLFAADAHARYGRFEAAEELLARAAGRTSQPAVWRTTAQIARYRGDMKTALAHWRRVLEVEPTSLDAHRWTALHTAEVEGRPAALRHLEQTCERFPHNFLLHQLWADWARDEGPAVAEPIIRRLIAVNPAEGWSRRELALNLAAQGRLDAALAEAREAAQFEPNNPSTHTVLGDIFVRLGDTESARAAFRDAIRLEVDVTYAIQRLVSASRTLEERKEALAFVEKELIRQVVFGDGVLAFREEARAILPPDEVLRLLRLAQRERPDLWQTWSALAEQLASMGSLDEARELAQQATTRFPLVPRVWIDLSTIQHLNLDSTGELASLEHAWQLNPGWGRAVHALASAHERTGRFEQSLSVLERASAHAPLDATTHGGAADALWKLGRKPEALERLQRALCLDPNYDWGWRALRAWSQELGRPELPVSLARNLTERRSGEARPWLTFAQMVYRRDQPEESLAAIERAIQAQPRFIEAHDMRAEVLAMLGRFSDALAACAPAVFGDRSPVELQARAAWIEASRNELDKAIFMMRAALKENPAFGWGWRELAEWLWRRERYEEALEAATQLARLDPANPIPLGYRAELKLHRNDKEGAMADFARAFQIDPAYTYAGFALFDLQLEKNLLDDAEKTRAILRLHCSSEDAAAAEVRLGCRWIQRSATDSDGAGAMQKRREQTGRVLDAFRSLCGSTRDAGRALEQAAQALREIGFNDEIGSIVRAALDETNANPAVGTLWMQERLRQKRLNYSRRFPRLLERGEIGVRALVAYIEGLGEVLARGKLRRVLRKHRELLQADDRGWGAGLYALVNSDLNRDAVQWAGDWSARPGAQMWMLRNIAYALRCLGREGDAHAVVLHALRLPARDQTWRGLVLWRAAEEALAGDTESAAKHLDEVSSEGLGPFDERVRVLARGMIDVQRAPAGERRAVFREARFRVLAAYGAVSPARSGKMGRRDYRRYVGRMARDAGSVWGVFAAWLRSCVG